MKAKSVRGETTRRRILESAASLICERGVNGTSVDDVLSASGTGKSQFYHYFKSKDALVHEILEYQRERFAALDFDSIQRIESLNQFDQWLDAIISDFEAGRYSDGCPLGNLAGEMAGQNESLRTSLDAVFARWEGLLATVFTRLLAKGVLRRDHPVDVLAQYVVSSIEGALLLAKTHRDSGPVKTMLNMLKGFVRSQSIGATAKGAGPVRKPIQPLSYCP